MQLSCESLTITYIYVIVVSVIRKRVRIVTI